MVQGDIVVERLTGKYVVLLQRVDHEWICRFADGRSESRNAFELAPSPLARLIELSATTAGTLSSWFKWLQTTLGEVVPPPRLLRLRALSEATASETSSEARQRQHG